MLVSERIRSLAAHKGMSLKDFSDAVGVNYRTLQHYLSGQRSVGAEFLTAVGDHLDASVTWLLTGKGPMFVGELGTDGPFDEPSFVPVTRFTVEASAGHGSLVQDETGSGTYAYNRAFLDRRGLKPTDLAVISVRGDSMEPDLHDGDLILIDRAEVRRDEIKDGRIYVVTYGGDLYVKRIQRLPQQGLMLVSSNPVYQPVMVDGGQMDGVKIIGRVVNSTHEW